MMGALELSKGQFRGPVKFYDGRGGWARQDFQSMAEPRFGYAWQREDRNDRGRTWWMVDGKEVADFDEADRLLASPPAADSPDQPDGPDSPGQPDGPDGAGGAEEHAGANLGLAGPGVSGTARSGTGDNSPPLDGAGSGCRQGEGGSGGNDGSIGDDRSDRDDGSDGRGGSGDASPATGGDESDRDDASDDGEPEPPD